MLFCSGRNGTASYSPDVPGEDLKPLFDTILEYIPAPEMNLEAAFQMLVSNIDYNEFVGRIAIGLIQRGTIRQNQEIEVCNYHDPDAAPRKAKAVSLYEFNGLQRDPVTEVGAGNIIAMKEFDLIEFLMKNPGKVYSREQLLDLVWGYDYQGDIRTVDVHIRRLREKLEKDPAKPEYIVTKWGIGYYFAD